MSMFLIGQAVGAVAMIECFFIYQCRDRRKMVFLKLIDDLLWSTHFLLIGGFTAALTSIIAIFRELVFYNKGNKRWESSAWWAVGFSVLFLACAPLTWKNIFSIFPAAASVVATWVFWVSKTRMAKLIQLPSTVCMLVYTLVYKSYSGVLTQMISIVSIAVYFVRERRSKSKISKENDQNEKT